jgi:hypothetical protein
LDTAERKVSLVSYRAGSHRMSAIPIAITFSRRKSSIF